MLFFQGVFIAQKWLFIQSLLLVHNNQNMRLNMGFYSGFSQKISIFLKKHLIRKCKIYWKKVWTIQKCCFVGQKRSWPRCFEGPKKSWPRCFLGQKKSWPSCFTKRKKSWPRCNSARPRIPINFDHPLIRLSRSSNKDLFGIIIVWSKVPFSFLDFPLNTDNVV